MSFIQYHHFSYGLSCRLQTTVTLMILLVAICVQAQPAAAPGVEMLRLYDGGQTVHERFEDVYHLANGGYYVCGASNGRPWLLKVSESGDPIWNSIRGQVTGFAGDLYSTVIETDNGDALVGGKVSGMFNAALRDQDNGEDIWSHNYISGWCEAAIELKAGNLVLAGHNSTEAYMTMVQANGDPIWDLYFRDGQNVTTFRAIRETEGGIVAVGEAGRAWWYDSPNGEKALLVKVDFDGNIVWSKTYENNPLVNSAPALVSRPEGGFTFGWNRNDNAHGRGSYFALTIVDEHGENALDKLFFNGISSSHLACLNRLSDGGYVVVGATVFDNGTFGYRMIRTDRNGDQIWSTYLEDVIGERWPGNININYWWLRSVIVQDQDKIVTCGEFYNRDNDNTSDAILLRLQPDQLSPMVISRIPEDSILTVLPDTTIHFTVVARNRLGENYDMVQHWALGDSVIGEDTTVSIHFADLGSYAVTCSLYASDWITTVDWTVFVKDFFIASHTPDSLRLALRRGTTVDFSLDSVAAVGNDPIFYNWNLADLNRQENRDISDSSSASVLFRQSDNYRVEAYAYRDTLSDAVTWNIVVRSVVLNFFPVQQTLSVPNDTIIHFEVIPFDPTDSLTYNWALDGEWAGSFPTAEFQFHGEGLHNVTAIVSDSTDADTIVWNVSIRPNSAANPVFQLSAFSFSLSPNPLNARSTIHFTLPVASPVRLTLHDLTGREVHSLAKGQFGAGEHQIAMDATELTAGLYFLRMEAGGKAKIAKAVVIK